MNEELKAVAALNQQLDAMTKERDVLTSQLDMIEKELLSVPLRRELEEELAGTKLSLHKIYAERTHLRNSVDGDKAELVQLRAELAQSEAARKKEGIEHAAELGRMIRQVQKLQRGRVAAPDPDEAMLMQAAPLWALAGIIDRQRTDDAVVDGIAAAVRALDAIRARKRGE